MEKTTLIVVLLSIFFSTGGYSADKPFLIISSGKRIRSPEKGLPVLADVDLSPQFRDENTCQSGGTCHIHTAVNLIEAACYRVTGVKLDLSEAYYYYRHLREGLEKGYPIDKKVDALAATHKDGGIAERTVERFTNGSVCKEGDFACTTSNFVRWTRENGDFLAEKVEETAEERERIAAKKALIFKRLSAKYARYSAVKETKADYPVFFRNEMDRAVGEVIKIASVYDAKNGHVVKSKDPNVLDCIKAKLNVKRIKYSEEVALALMSRGLPVASSGNVAYEFDEKLDFDSLHIFTLNGYLHNSKKKLSYLHRDSNEPNLREMKCQHLVVVYTDAEKKLVEDAQD